MVKYLKPMTLAELAAFCTGVLVENGAVLDGEWVRPTAKRTCQRKTPVVRLCACRKVLPPPGPKGGHPLVWCSKKCPARTRHAA